MKIKVAKHDSVNGCLLVEVSVAAAFCKEFLSYLQEYGRCSGRLADNDLVPVVGAAFLHELADVDWSHLYALLLADEQVIVPRLNDKEVSNE